MWRLFNALCMLSVIALLGLHGGEARSLPERPQWRSDVDGMGCGKLDRASLGASARVFGVPASAGPRAHWPSPAEISARALVWQPPGEIAAAMARALVDFVATASIAPSASSWTPPAEIAAETPGRPSTFAEPSRIWLPPMEIAAAKSAEQSENPAIERRSAFTSGARDWRPPAEIALTRAAADGVDDVVAGLAARASPRRPSKNWAPPAEIATPLSLSLGPMIASRALVWLQPAEIAKPRLAMQ
jgi:hypothetical protein